jgi:lipopolysaccharide biosynthesis regulator YciM
MDTSSSLMLVILFTLLVGMTIGKFWERYKLREGRWTDRRRAKQTPHYMIGLNFMVANQPDLAIEELNKAISLDTEAIEIHMILGNLYREKGQISRAIHTHQKLLQRPNLTAMEHAYVLLCLGLDFKRGGFLDRALEAFDEVLRLDSNNRYALLNLEKLYAEQHQWELAHNAREKTMALHNNDSQTNKPILAFLKNELGLVAQQQQNSVEAKHYFETAIELSEQTIPAYLHLGDAQLISGDVAGAAETWERLIDVAPDRAYLVFDRLSEVYPRLGSLNKFKTLCQTLINANKKDWRARLALGRYLLEQKDAKNALELLFEAIIYNPHSLSIHQTIWSNLIELQLQPNLVKHYMELTKKSIFYLDPHICMKCRYRSTELLWQCPNCHEWNTFLEEIIAPAETGDTKPRE